MHIESRIPTAPFPRPGRTGLVLAAALACAALTSACGSSGSKSHSEPPPGSKPVNTAQVAASIEETLLKKRHIHAKVSCPASVLAEKGKTFVCIAKSTNPKKRSETIQTPFKVTIQTNRGYVTYVGE
jgi:hypothetical protein